MDTQRSAEELIAEGYKPMKGLEMFWTKEDEPDLSLWNDTIIKEDPSTAELKYILEQLLSMIHHDRFEELDGLLRDMDVEKISIDGMVACLRTPFVVRDRLPNWKPYVQRCYEEFANRGEDADGLCRGLL